MKKYLILLMTIISGITMGQLSGTAFLQNQTNHAGIRVKFASQGGTAVTDSTYTDATGNYTINITSGVYCITFAKAGYIDEFYNNGASVLLTNTTVVSSTTLSLGNAVFVNGVVTGTWSNNNVYVVMCDLTIPPNNTLTIMPGTKIQFNGYFGIYGGGVIHALGTNNSPILFTSGMQNETRTDWKQISLTSTKSKFDNCIFEYSAFSLNFQSGGADITNSIFRHGGSLGAYIAAGTPLIDNNEVYDMDNSQGVIGIWVEGAASGTISCNYIHDINSSGYNSYGIIHNSSLVTNNHINNITGLNPIGIQTRYAGSRIISNCISNSGAAIDIDGSFASSNPIIVNNTLFSNSKGITIHCNNPVSPTIVNNLITGNGSGIIEYGTTNGTITIDHNLVWNNSANYANVQVVGLGQTVTVNSSGYPIDAYFNMSQDPLYSGAPPILSSSSPCDGTGNTTYSGNIGFNNPQGCAATILGINKEVNFSKLSIYPNPSSGTFSVFSRPGEQMVISIFDMSGREVYITYVFSGQQIHVDHLKDGIYMLTIKKEEDVLIRRIVLSK